MPCQGGCQSQAESEYPLVSKALCAVMTVLEQQGALRKMLDAIDWTEAGIREASLQSWWDQHKQNDKARRQREASDKRREKIAQEAYDKLTPAQREALGVRAPGKY